MLPADNSVDHMFAGRIERVWNDINNWAEKPRYVMSELDTYTKVEESEEDWELYPMTNCTYVQSIRIPMNETRPYGRETVEFAFPKGMKWVRVFATDIAWNSAFGMPVFLKQ